MSFRPLFVALALAGVLAAPGWAQDYHAGALTVEHPYAFATAPGMRAGAGYFTVSNAGDATDRLLEVRADFPGVEMHDTEVDASGVARMTPVEAAEIPPGGTVAFEPRGLHVMFMGLTAPLEAGTSFGATLVFEKAGEVEVEFHVEPRGHSAPSHEGMDQ